MMRTNIITPCDRTDAFYAAIGPFFMSSSVRKEMPYLEDRPDKTWFAVRTPTNAIVAIAGVQPELVRRDQVGFLCSLYVQPSHRGAGIGRDLIRARLDWMASSLPGHAPRTMCVPELAPLYRALGFDTLWTRGKYSMMERSAP